MIEDVDGFVVGKACLAGTSFPAALRAHLTGTGHATRFRKFYADRFASSTVTAKAAANTMLVDVGADDTLDALRDAVIISSAGIGVTMPGNLAAAARDSFVGGFAERVKQLASIG